MAGPACLAEPNETRCMVIAAWAFAKTFLPVPGSNRVFSFFEHVFIVRCIV